MKSVLRYTAAGVALATFGFASAASAATDDAQVTAQILSTLAVNDVVGDNILNFGTVLDAGLLADRILEQATPTAEDLDEGTE